MQGILGDFILSGEGIVMLEELEVFIILDTIFDVESQRQVVEDPLSPTGIVIRHCLEECLLIAYEEVVAEVVMDVHGPYLSDWVFGHPEELTPQFHVLLYYTLLVRVEDPILLPLGVLMGIEKRKVLWCLLINLFRLKTRKRLSFPLGLEDGGDFDLCPYEIGILMFICELKPGATLHDTFYEV